MTRINLISTKELSDQHLLAEYRELPRVIKGNFNIDNAPTKYCLGKGHIKWAKLHSAYLMLRYDLICQEMKYRGFTVNYPSKSLIKEWDGGHMYFPSKEDIEISKRRLIEKYKLKPKWYKWTNREKPKYFS